MVFHATCNNISVISWRYILLVEETGVPRENHRPVASHWQTLSHNVVSSTPLLSCIRTHNVSGNRHAILYSKPLQTLWLVRINIERSRNCLPLAHEFTPDFLWGPCCSSFSCFVLSYYVSLRSDMSNLLWVMRS